MRCLFRDDPWRSRPLRSVYDEFTRPGRTVLRLVGAIQHDGVNPGALSSIRPNVQRQVLSNLPGRPAAALAVGPSAEDVAAGPRTNVAGLRPPRPPAFARRLQSKFPYNLKPVSPGLLRLGGLLSLKSYDRKA